MHSSMLFFAALLAACSASDQVEPRACTTIGYVNGYTLDFEASSWTQGKYTVELTVDGKPCTCEATLPLDASSKSTCTLPEVQLRLSGSALPAGEQGLSGLLFTSQPAKIDVTVKLDGATLGQPASFTPAYKTSQPNGPECGPTCTNARDTAEAVSAASRAPGPASLPFTASPLPPPPSPHSGSNEEGQG
jgi:hypothetical protein